MIGSCRGDLEPPAPPQPNTRRTPAPIANPGRAALEADLQEVETRFPDGDVPLPPHWGGFSVAPDAIEFWQGRENRLHDRIRYARQREGSWRIERLSP